MDNNDIVYGKNAVEGLFKSNRVKRINKILIFSGAKKDTKISEIIKMANENRIPLQFVPKEKLSALTSQVHQGVIAMISPIEYASLEDILEKNKDKEENSLMIMLDGVQDPHNLGAIIRTAKCAGADAVIIPKRNTSLVTSTVEKTSAGAASLIPIVQVSNLNNAIETIKKYGFWVYGAEADGEISYTKAKYNSNTLFVMGGENQGVSKLTREKCDVIVKINMKGEFNSLNVSNAASILMFEFLRQQGV